MGNYKKLLNNSILFAIGNFGSKFITFLLVPFYAHYLSAEQFGISDTMLTTITNLIAPVVFLSIYDAVLRFGLDSSYDKEKVISNSIFIGIFGFCIALVFLPILMLTSFKIYIHYFYILLALAFFQNLFGQYARSKGKVQLFSLNGILLSIFIAMFSYIFIVQLRKGLDGFFLAQIIAYSLSDIILFFGSDACHDISPKFVTKQDIRILLIYSIPLVPNSIMWWLMTVSSRYLVLYLSGAYWTGLFVAASKFPSLLSTVNQVFIQAWQISAVEEERSTTAVDYYTTVFKSLASMLFISSSLLTMLIKPLFSILFSSDYFTAWYLVPLLTLGTIFSAFSDYFTTNYIVSKKTEGILRTSMYGGLVNFLLNIVLITFLGLVGAALSNAISFFVIFLLRYYGTKDIVDVKIDWTQIYGSILLIILQLILLFFDLEIMLLIQFLLLICIVYLNKFFICTLINKIVR